MKIDKDTLLPCPFCGSKNIQYCGGIVECMDCGTEGPIFKTQAASYVAWNTRTHIDKDTLRAALEGAVKPQIILGCLNEANDGAWTEYDGHEIVRIDGDINIVLLSARILSAIDLDTPAAKLGGKDESN